MGTLLPRGPTSPIFSVRLHVKRRGLKDQQQKGKQATKPVLTGAHFLPSQRACNRQIFDARWCPAEVRFDHSLSDKGGIAATRAISHSLSGKATGQDTELQALTKPTPH